MARSGNFKGIAPMTKYSKLLFVLAAAFVYWRAAGYLRNPLADLRRG